MIWSSCWQALQSLRARRGELVQQVGRSLTAVLVATGPKFGLGGEAGSDHTGEAGDDPLKRGPAFEALFYDETQQPGPSYTFEVSAQALPETESFCAFENTVAEDNPNVPNTAVTTVQSAEDFAAQRAFRAQATEFNASSPTAATTMPARTA